MATKLTYSQRDVMARLANANDSTHQSGITNPTLCALQRRGLVTHRTINKMVELRYDDWQLTDAGRAALRAK